MVCILVSMLRRRLVCLIIDAEYRLREAPAGYQYVSTIFDTAATLHFIKDRSWFSRMWPSRCSIKTANDVVEQATEAGSVTMHTYSSSGKRASLMLTNAVHAPKIQTLVSGTQLLDDGCEVQLSAKRSYIVLPDQEAQHSPAASCAWSLVYRSSCAYFGRVYLVCVCMHIIYLFYSHCCLWHISA